MTDPAWSPSTDPTAPADAAARGFGALDPDRPTTPPPPAPPPVGPPVGQAQAATYPYPAAPDASGYAPVSAAPVTSPYPTGYGPAPSYGGYGGYGVPGGPQPIFIQQPRNNGLAMASMIVSIVGVVLLVCYGIGGAAGLVGAILGHVARRQIRERQEGGDGMALAGVIVGWVVVGISVLIVGILVALFATAMSMTPSDPAFEDGFNDGFDAIRLVLGSLS